MSDLFFGRRHELNLLRNEYKKEYSNLIVLYGRRRVGKSTLIEKFAHNLPFLSFDGIEGESTLEQIDHFRNQLHKQIKDPLLEDVKWTKWEKVFDYLTNYLSVQGKKVTIFLDEYQWMSCQQSKLTAILKSYWDLKWKHKNKVCLILCGSVSSFMVNKVIHSKALYGRIHLELKITPLNLGDTYLMLKKRRSMLECLQYYLIFGGVPKYYEFIEVNKSFVKNIDNICFKKEAPLLNEYEKIFYSQFKGPRNYERIISLLEGGAKTYTEVITSLKMKDGGGAKSYLSNLEIAGFIQASNFPLKSAKEKKYYISDDFIRFYHKFIKKNVTLINQGYSQQIFQNQIIHQWKPWLGLAFEFFCVKNSSFIAKLMGFADEITGVGSFFQKGTLNESGVQIDLIYLRNNIITVCEIKLTDKPIGPEIISEFNEKIEKLKPYLKNYTMLEFALISPSGVTKSLQQKKYFQHVVTLEDLFQEVV